ncbi:CLUMA_CG016649, isoform A [Clunio marinus]|uniref:CLUMA_CG016649, isoform A n=1 Tax=Clunio marinus TaxID=568069 RepID=A0A1J1ISN6_9DIPT|nr:CLUMA_CG016649, isoform A [Clunio marinus]
MFTTSLQDVMSPQLKTAFHSLPPFNLINCNTFLHAKKENTSTRHFQHFIDLKLFAILLRSHKHKKQIILRYFMTSLACFSSKCEMLLKVERTENKCEIYSSIRSNLGRSTMMVDQCLNETNAGKIKIESQDEVANNKLSNYRNEMYSTN